MPLIHPAGSCQHPRDDLYRHTLTMPNGMFPVVCTRCWAQSMSPDAGLPVWTDQVAARYRAAIEMLNRNTRIDILRGLG